LAGFVCGWALASEFSCGLFVLSLILWLCFKKEFTRLFIFLIGCFPPLLLIPIYSFVCFENPFVLAYSYHSSFPAMKEGVFAIKLPDFTTALNILFSPTRGLFFYTPFLILACFGFYQIYLRNKCLSIIFLAAPVLQIIIMSGRTWDWQAGPSFGPRLLAPVLPFLALPCAFGAAKMRKLAILLAAYSIIITTLAVLIDATPDGIITNPLVEFHFPKLLEADISNNLALVLGLPKYISILAFYCLVYGGVFLINHHLMSRMASAGNIRSNEHTCCYTSIQ